MHTIVKFHRVNQLLATSHFFIVHHPTFLVSSLKDGTLVNVSALLCLELSLVPLFSDFFIHHGDWTKDDFIERFLLLGVKLSHLCNFEFEQREGIFDVLNISELRTLHSRWKNIILTFLNRKIEPYNIIAVDEWYFFARYRHPHRCSSSSQPSFHSLLWTISQQEKK